MSARTSSSRVQRLAAAFSQALADNITLAEMDIVRARNLASAGRGDPSVCASHDFCDANEVMYHAFYDAMARPWNAESDADNLLVDDAWTVAKANGFRMTAQVSK